VAAIILGAGTLLDPAFTAAYGAGASGFALKLILFPLLVQAVGVLASIIGTWSVRARGGENPMAPISRGLWVSAIAAVVGFCVVNAFYLIDPRTGSPDWRFSSALFSGLVLALFIRWLTDQFTSTDRRPVTEMAYSSKTGPATFLLSGLGFGLESSVWATLAICGTILASFTIFQGDLVLAGYGVALAGLGLLTMTGYILAMDTFGPIVDNANGIYEMSGVGHHPAAPGGVDAGQVVAQLDQAGNTTKALTKGFAIASAVLAATALFRSFVDQARLVATAGDLSRALQQGAAAVAGAVEHAGIQVNLPLIFIGLLIGGSVPFLVSAFLIRAVGRSAFQVVEEVRRQFREIPGIMEGTAKPQYYRCVDIATVAAQRELLSPAIIAISAPIAVGMGIGAAPLGGFLAGAILTGQLMAVFQANTGGAWDNAKKKIEDGFLGGKGTEYHKAGVIGDTVGDPMKDTAGPALNPLIKVMNLVSLLIAPVTIAPVPAGVRAVVVAVTLALMAYAVAINRRSTFSPADIEAAARMTPTVRAAE